MITAGLFVIVAFAFISVLAYLDQARRVRGERAYWAARDHRPPLFDWAEELDL